MCEVCGKGRISINSKQTWLNARAKVREEHRLAEIHVRIANTLQRTAPVGNWFRGQNLEISQIFRGECII